MTAQARRQIQSLAPRGMTRADVKAYLRLPEGRGDAMLKTMMDHYGFPRALPEFGRWDLKAVDAWLDARSGLGAPSFDVEKILEGFGDGDQGALRQ